MPNNFLSGREFRAGRHPSYLDNNRMSLEPAPDEEGDELDALFAELSETRKAVPLPRSERYDALTGEPVSEYARSSARKPLSSRRRELDSRTDPFEVLEGQLSKIEATDASSFEQKLGALREQLNRRSGALTGSEQKPYGAAARQPEPRSVFFRDQYLRRDLGFREEQPSPSHDPGYDPKAAPEAMRKRIEAYLELSEGLNRNRVIRDSRGDDGSPVFPSLDNQALSDWDGRMDVRPREKLANEYDVSLPAVPPDPSLERKLADLERSLAILEARLDLRTKGPSEDE